MGKLKLNLNVDVIDQLIPHSDPFLFVDNVIETSDDFTFIKTQKTLTGDEDFFRGHFPTKKIFPGVLIIEGFGQSFAILGSIKSFIKQGHNLDDIKQIASIQKQTVQNEQDSEHNSQNLVYLIKVDVKFIKLVEVGETITFNVSQKSLENQKLKKVEVFATTKNGVVAKGTLTTYDVE